MGAGERAVLFFQKDVINLKDTSLSLLYPPALGTILIGYWASRALDPSSKARDDIGLYTLVAFPRARQYTFELKRPELSNQLPLEDAFEMFCERVHVIVRV
ncbi:hypothetical protein CK203_032396 [Vitis vinifera]|uniref:Uncharacterized protein n=1 Tax=Vitis vinifera TaxID=29760 RepID=A0A438IJZ9_VITVI|nr:hypothetical protein CK203_032396 [Vitis vinifera]